MAGIAQSGLKQGMAADGDLNYASFFNQGPQKDSDDTDHGIGDPTQNQAVHEQSQVSGFESAQKRSRLAAIPDLSELDIGKNLGAAPVARKKEDRHHAADAEAPPQPVSGDALRGNHATDEQGRVGGKSGGDHGSPSQPPGD